MKIFQQKQKLSNLSRNTKVSLGTFSNQQLDIIKQLINQMYSYAFTNTTPKKVKDTRLLQLFQKIIQKYSLTTSNYQISFSTIPVFSHTDYYARMFASFLDKINSFLSNCNNPIVDYAQFFTLLNNNTISSLISMNSVHASSNALNTAQSLDALRSTSVIHNVQITNENSVEKAQNQVVTVKSLGVKQIVGPKQTQIAETDAKTLIETMDVKDVFVKAYKQQVQQDIAQNFSSNSASSQSSMSSI